MNFTNQQEEYIKKITYMEENISNTMYIFEVTKLCGHGEFVLIDKDDTLFNLYNTVARYFGATHIDHLLIRNEETGDTKKIPITNMTVREYIYKGLSDNEMRWFFRPIYKEPAKTVYRIIYDDGHTHNCGC
jgi:hypothetical protein